MCSASADSSCLASLHCCALCPYAAQTLPAARVDEESADTIVSFAYRSAKTRRPSWR